jgi:hypothetical protein
VESISTTRRVRLAVAMAFLSASAAAEGACSGTAGSLAVPDAGADAARTSSGGSGSGSGGGGSGGSSGAGSSSGGSGGGSGSSSGSGGGSGGGSGSSSGGTDSGACPPCDPANVNLPGVACDLDCSGTMKPPGPCDTALPMSGTAAQIAQAIGICQTATPTQWGLVSATLTQGYSNTTAPAAGQTAILPAYGTSIEPREGAMLGVLSTGYAYDCDDPSPTAACAGTGAADAGGGQGDPYFKGPQPERTGAGAPPPGFPKGSATCALATTVFDVASLVLQIKVPGNVSGFTFDSAFFTSDWPEYVCTTFNDQFVAWLTSSAWGGSNGNLNVLFDSAGNAMSVNNAFITGCTPATPTGCMGSVMGTSTCPGGTAALGGTGFLDVGAYCTTSSAGGASTGWLTTSAPVKGGETITLQFMVWDTGDQNWDSLALIDHFAWTGSPVPAQTAPAK